MSESQWYKDYFDKEIDFAEENTFTGKITFEVNFREGNIGNMNIGINQSVKREASYGKT